MTNEKKRDEDQIEPSSNADLDMEVYTGEKGMKPVPNTVMINFLRWVRRYHPEIKNLHRLSEYNLQNLVAEFTSGRGQWSAWQSGFYLLLEGYSSKEGYQSARKELNDLGL